ncbi:MAG: molybdate transport system substrate-binding protein [Microbacteriaceae bacterium]|nr:molybdate transport system substrate-binding protein [Microbacteriaceae bacterium]
MIRRACAVALLAAAVLALTACGARPSGATGAGETSRASAQPSGAITVDAAASLSRVFPKIAAAFERQHPGTKVRFSFGGSSTLAAQIVAGGPVDVFAAASSATMRTVTAAGLTAEKPVVIARNRLEIAVPKGDPGRITRLADFADPARTVVVCDPSVPCGAAARQVFTLARIAAKPDSYEPDVTGVLTKVRLGEADAGLVYRTDVRGAGGAVEGIPFPESARAITDYPIAPLRDSTNARLAAAFVDWVVRHGAQDLAAAGFLAAQ